MGAKDHAVYCDDFGYFTGLLAPGALLKPDRWSLLPADAMTMDEELAVKLTTLLTEISADDDPPRKYEAVKLSHL